MLAVFAVLGALGLILLPRIGFDADPLHTKNPNTEAMQTLYDLGDSPLTNPFTIDILAAQRRCRRRAGGEAPQAAAGFGRAVDRQFCAGRPTDQTGPDRRCRHADGTEPVPAGDAPAADRARDPAGGQERAGEDRARR